MEISAYEEICEVIDGIKICSVGDGICINALFLCAFTFVKLREKFMRFIRYGKIMAWVLSLMLYFMASAQAQTVSFRLIKVIPLPTVDRGGDVVSYDPSNHKVYVSMGNTDAGGVIINADNDTLVKVVRNGIVRPGGIAWNNKYVYWTSDVHLKENKDGKDATVKRFGRVVVVDKNNWKTVDTFTTLGTGADGIWADQGLGRLYVALDNSNWIEEYTLGKQPKVVGKINLFPATGDGPDLGVLVSAQHLLYMPDDSWEEKINLLNGQIEAKANIAPYFSASSTGHHPNTKGQIYDPQSQTVWVGTNRSQLFVFDAKSMKVLAHLPAHAGIDQVAYDPTYHLVYAFESDAKGFNVYNAQTMKPVTFVSTGYGKAHTGAVDPSNHKIFVYVGEAHAVYVYQPVHG